jgi:hypothetical protein
MNGFPKRIIEMARTLHHSVKPGLATSASPFVPKTQNPVQCGTQTLAVLSMAGPPLDTFSIPPARLHSMLEKCGAGAGQLPRKVAGRVHGRHRSVTFRETCRDVNSAKLSGLSLQIVVGFIKILIREVTTALQETLDFDTRCWFIYISPRIFFNQVLTEIFVASVVFRSGRSYLVTQ